MAETKVIYTVGGTVQASGGLYIERAADKELFELCRQGELVFILSSRQVGKSSLMVRTAETLTGEGIQSVIIDLSAIGVNVTPDEWYLGILNEIANTLDLETDIFSWWSRNVRLSPAQRLSNFFRDVLLKEISERVVLFFDEIDSTLSIPFSDDFFTTIRAIYNARSTIKNFERLSFVLIGVATPSDLISDSRRTPFNIGRRLDLNDFTLEEANPLANGVGENAERVLEWVFDWTGGHPYLTQCLCAYLARSKSGLSKEDVADAVVELFLGESGNQDNNLQFVRDMLIRRAPDAQKVLKVYKNIRSGNKITDDEHSIIKSHLKLSGVVRSEHEKLQVRNQIYNSVFNLQWVREVTPRNWTRTMAIVFAGLTFILLFIFTYEQTTRSLTLTTAPDPTSFSSVGQQIVYTYVILNNGNVSLGPAQFTITDDKIGNSFNCGNDKTTLASGDYISCSISYFITEADMTAGSVTNTAYASDGKTTSYKVTTTISRGATAPSTNLIPGYTVQHTVEKGDWLSQIARCYGANLLEVENVNPQITDPNSDLSPGTVVAVPNIGSSGTIYGPPCVVFHTVQGGDTWTSIALLYNADPSILRDVNPGELSVDRVLKIPLNSASEIPTRIITP